MSNTLVTTFLSGCTPDRFVRIGAGLLEVVRADPRPRLLIAELQGEAVLLGRHQRASSALDRGAWEASSIPLLRRCGGGRALVAGAGRIGVYLALPRRDALLDTPIPADRVINRYVRGLLAGLTKAGAGSGAHYFGRDFVSSESRQLSRISHDGLGDGPTLFEGIVGVTESLELPPTLGGYPVHSDPQAEGPPAVTLDELWNEPHGVEAIARAIVAGYEGAFDVKAERVDEDLPEEMIAPATWEEEEGFEESGVADIPIGFAEALLRHEGGKIEEVRFRGDFIAPAFAVRALEQELEGVALNFQAIGEVVDAAFRKEGAAILGVRGLRIFPDAVLAAAGLL